MPEEIRKSERSRKSIQLYGDSTSFDTNNDDSNESETEKCTFCVILFVNPKYMLLFIIFITIF